MLGNLVNGFRGFETSVPEYVRNNLVGWTAASAFAKEFRKLQGGFPVLNVYGPAGSGKTSLVRAVSSMCRSDVRHVGPETTLLRGNTGVLALVKSEMIVVDEIVPTRTRLQDLCNFSLHVYGREAFSTSFVLVSEEKLDLGDTAIYVGLPRPQADTAQAWQRFQEALPALSLIGEVEEAKSDVLSVLGFLDLDLTGGRSTAANAQRVVAFGLQHFAQVLGSVPFALRVAQESLGDSYTITVKAK